ncbi:MAG: NUDIX hydrolase [Candidatus Latescibacterota bacterium]|nr:NUDIX hydrolase [Candidatus Latescibacterota bacterium]
MNTITRDFTATTFVVSNNCTLLLWHRKLRAWLPPGGHIESNELPEEAAIREVREETGLTVRIVGSQRKMQSVKVLHSPRAILLEDIEPGHQHIDLIYFAKIVDGSLSINRRESVKFKWFNTAQLDSKEIADDINQLGKQAIATCFP